MEKPKSPEHLDELLDEAIEESFPASDPPAVHRHDDPPKRGTKARTMPREIPPPQRSPAKTKT